MVVTGNHQRLESHQAVRANRIRENQATIQAVEEHQTQTGHTQIPSVSQGVGKTSSPVASHHSVTNRSVAKSHHSSQSQEVSRRRQGYKGKKDPFQSKAERIRPNDPEAVGFGERNTQEPKIVVHTSIISSPIHRNITPSQIENDVVTPDGNLNSDSLWLQMSQFVEKTPKKLSELQASN
ncbi:hypothetical protein O181_085754 [Austropuccinia psidii MF-1]|uniref:Uncharacterized protein n=1 Tax=Austropuccinia psidii MF-1 TaxID=1389203 RepID=A0A9Q3IN37_9BASI|nr:hypothetical protein [Austropuccinia psidii MF-1]